MIIREHWKKNLLFTVVCLFWICFSALYSLGLFVDKGMYFLDGGWLTYSFSSFSGENPFLLSQIWGAESILSLHTFITPLLINTSIAAFVGPTWAFVLLMGITFGVLSLTFSLLADFLTASEQFKLSTFLFITLCGLFGPFSILTIGSLGYPHPEVLGSALVVSGWSLIARKSYVAGGTIRSRIGGYVVISAGFLVREDIPLHLLLTIGVSAFVLRLESQQARDVKKIVGLSFGALAVHLCVSFLVGSPANGSVFSDQYGSMSDIVSGAMRFSWVSPLVESNPILIFLLLALASTMLVFHDRVILVGLICTVPWLIVNGASGNPAKQSLGLYHGFPLLIYFLIPIILDSPAKRNSSKKYDDETLLHRGRKYFEDRYKNFQGTRLRGFPSDSLDTLKLEAEVRGSERMRLSTRLGLLLIVATSFGAWLTPPLGSSHVRPEVAKWREYVSSELLDPTFIAEFVASFSDIKGNVATDGASASLVPNLGDTYLGAQEANIVVYMRNYGLDLALVEQEVIDWKAVGSYCHETSSLTVLFKKPEVDLSSLISKGFISCE